MMNDNAEQLNDVVITSSKRRVQGIVAIEPETIRKNPSANAGIESVLKTFAGVFPVGKPHAPYYQGLYNWLNGETSKAITNWKKSLVEAEKLNMPLEIGLAHYRLGSVAADSKERIVHLNQAKEIFERPFF